jgi:hypothetical protein
MSSTRNCIPKKWNMMKYIPLFKFLSLIIAMMLMYQCTGKDQIEIKVEEDKQKVEVLINGDRFTSYIYPERIKKPVLWPVISPGGNVLTRSYPMVIKEGDRTDHPHHVGVWLNYGDVNGLDFWNNSEAIDPEERNHYGTIRHVAIEKAEGGRNEAELITRSQWLTPDNEPLLSEETTFHFRAREGLRIIDRSALLESLVDTVRFRDNKEGVFAIRVVRELELPSEGAVKLVDAHGNITVVEGADNQVANGNYRSAEGIEGAEVWGTRCRWMKLQGEINGEKVSLVIIDHPSNSGYPTYWHARGYGLFAANTLGQKVFSKGSQELNFYLTRGERATFKYRLVVASMDLSDAQINQLADAFANIPD